MKRILIVDAGIHNIGCTLGCLRLMDIEVVEVKRKELPTLLDVDMGLKVPALDMEFKILAKDAFEGWPVIDKPLKDWEHRRSNNWKSKRRKAR